MLRTRKSIGTGKGSDLDDDFKPIKSAASKRKPAEKKAVPQKSKVKEDVDMRAAESSVPKRKTAQRIVYDEDEDEEDDEMYFGPPPKTKPDVKKKAPAPANNKVSDKDEEVMEKAQPKRRAAAKSVIIDSADSENAKPSKGKGKAAPKRKR